MRGAGDRLSAGVGPSQLIKVIHKSLKKASFLSLKGAFSASKMPF
jgi:hypothetical protein